jgi:hypothetical protein
MGIWQLDHTETGPRPKVGLTNQDHRIVRLCTTCDRSADTQPDDTSNQRIDTIGTNPPPQTSTVAKHLKAQLIT